MHHQRLISFMILFLFLIIPSQGFCGQEEEAQKIYNEALVLINEEELVDAEILMRYLLLKYPRTNTAKEAGTILISLGDVAERQANFITESNIRVTMTGLDNYFKEHGGIPKKLKDIKGLPDDRWVTTELKNENGECFLESSHKYGSKRFKAPCRGYSEDIMEFSKHHDKSLEDVNDIRARVNLHLLVKNLEFYYEQNGEIPDSFEKLDFRVDPEIQIKIRKKTKQDIILDARNIKGKKEYSAFILGGIYFGLSNIEEKPIKK